MSILAIVQDENQEPFYLDFLKFADRKLILVMRSFGLLLLTLFSSVLMAQQETQEVKSRKGEAFLYWGWNRSMYSTSNIHLSGDDYDFTIENTLAHDRQTAFSAYNYFHPLRITIPQFNARIGYFISNNYSISIGADHMKYVVDSIQKVNINGFIENSCTDYDGVYEGESIDLASDLLLFEHTDGLNYINIELRRTDEFWRRNKISLDLSEGLGFGIMIPKTNATLLNNARHDDFHLAGYGFSAVGAAQLNFGKYFFVSSELKAGFIHMPDIRTTMYAEDKASQYFFFGQANIVFGLRF